MKTLEEMKAALDQITEKRILLQQKSDRLYKKYEKLNEQYYNIKYSADPTIEMICSIEEWNKIPYSLYTKFRIYLQKEHPYIYQDGYHAKTNQVAFSIISYTNPKQDYSKIEYLLTLIRPIDDRKLIHIIDSECSAKGVWTLVNGTILECTTYGHTRTVKEFSTVGEALEYIYQNLFSPLTDD